MLKYDTEQKVYDVAGVKIGGQPGEHPTVLIGTIFYDGHKIVEDSSKGKFDRKRAEELINRQDEISDETGVPCILDVVGEHSDALIKYIGFVSEVTDTPFLMDGIDADTRLETLRFIVESGLEERTVYNSIFKEADENELKTIRDTKVNSCILFSYSNDPSPEAKLELLENVPGKNKGLLEMAGKAGISQPMIDTAVLDVPSIGLSSRAAQLIKQKYGLPSGCAPANGLSLWRTTSTFSREFYRACESSAAVFVQSLGGDFILYGPIESAPTVFPAVATYDGILAYTAKWEVRTSPRSSHPLFKLFS